MKGCRGSARPSYTQVIKTLVDFKRVHHEPFFCIVFHLKSRQTDAFECIVRLVCRGLTASAKFSETDAFRYLPIWNTSASTAPSQTQLPLCHLPTRLIRIGGPSGSGAENDEEGRGTIGSNEDENKTRSEFDLATRG